jgi:enoyl-[acyl-carrier protein] reductase I
MPQLLAGKTALVLGVANRWSLAYAIAQAFVREGAKLILTYQGDRQKLTVEELAADLKADQTLSCDVTQDDQLANLTNELKSQGMVLNTVVHSIAFANREDLSRPFV